jgi:hypothetical protein
MGRNKVYTLEKMQELMTGHNSVKSAAEAIGMNYGTFMSHMQTVGLKSPMSTSPGTKRIFHQDQLKATDQDIFKAMLKHKGKYIAVAREVGIAPGSVKSRIGGNLELAHRLYLALEKQK